MNELALFAGAGGGILGGKLLGWRTVCAVEIDQYARDVLVSRQNDGCIDPFPIWDDIRTFDGKPWRGIVDVVSGGFPCTDISCAGKGAGIDGEQSGLWREMARIIGEVRPRHVWVENSPMLIRRGLARVLGNLSEMGYDAQWGIVGADDAGAPHHRKRIWILGHSTKFAKRKPAEKTISITNQRFARDESIHASSDVPNAMRNGRDERREEFQGQFRESTFIRAGDDVFNTEKPGLEGPEPAGNQRAGGCAAQYGRRGRESDWWQSEPNLGGVVDGLAVGLDQHGAHAAGNVARVAEGVRHRLSRLKCIGNGQVPEAMVLAWCNLQENIS